jgi:SAM-dependent methyltransferase
MLMAKAFPNSTFFGFDYHDKSIEGARDTAKREGLAGRLTFEVAKAKDFPGKYYDFVAVFDCLHDMADPVGAAAHVRRSLRNDATWMIVEPFANDELKDNLNPVGRVYYSFSTLLCTPCSRSQEVGLCLGAQSGEARIRDVVTSAGFSRFRRATEHCLRSSALNESLRHNGFTVARRDLTGRRWDALRIGVTCRWQLLLWDYFRVARQNEAAGAADAAAWVMLAVLIFGSDNLWVTRRCPCDPSTQNDAGRTPASSLF